MSTHACLNKGGSRSPDHRCTPRAMVLPRQRRTGTRQSFTVHHAIAANDLRAELPGGVLRCQDSCAKTRAFGASAGTVTSM
jgi:hypothetical protein